VKLKARNKDGKVELLRNVSLFAACSKRDLSRIASLTDQIAVPSGKVLTRQGRPGFEAFVIVEGKAKANMRGRRSVSLGPGAFFGEMSLLDWGPRSATVTADTDMQLLVLDSRSFSSLLDDVPAVRRNIMKGMAERLRQAEPGEPAH
jgi:CRP/FNR family transcriptional regulator, cyclic AMP receptor protein